MKNIWFIFFFMICFSLSFLKNKEGIQNITREQAEKESTILLQNTKTASKAADNAYVTASSMEKSKKELNELKKVAYKNSVIVNSNVIKVLTYQRQFNPKYMKGKINSQIINQNFKDIMKLQFPSTYAVNEITYLEKKSKLI